MSFNGLLAHFFLALNSIPLSVCIQVVHFLLQDILLASKFWQLWMVSVNTHMKGFMRRHKFSTPLENYQQAWLLDLMLRVSFILEKMPKLFSKVTVPFYFPISNVWGFQFLYILAKFVIVCLFDYSCCSGCEVVSHCGFDLRFPDN